MQRVYEPRDLLEAEMLRGMLDAEGIEVYLNGRHLICLLYTSPSPRDS